MIGFCLHGRSHDLIVVVENLAVLQMLHLRALPQSQVELEGRIGMTMLRLTKGPKEPVGSSRVWSQLGLLVAGLSFEQLPAAL